MGRCHGGPRGRRRHRPDRPAMGAAELRAHEGPSRNDQPGILVEPRGGLSGGLLPAARGAQHMLLKQHGGHLRDTLCQLGQRGVQGGAGRVHLVAELSGVSIHGTGSSHHLSSDRPARRGPLITALCNPYSLITNGGVGHDHPAPHMAGTALALLSRQIVVARQGGPGLRHDASRRAPVSPRCCRIGALHLRTISPEDPGGRVSHLERDPRAVVHCERAWRISLLS
jgi:hypothetical protein